MTYLAKLLIWSIGAVGSCCAIGIPIALSARNASSVSADKVTENLLLVNSYGGGGRSDQTRRDSSSILASSLGDEEGSDSAEMSFDQLWNKLNEDFRQKQTWTSNEKQELTWKTEFEKIIVGRGSGNKWKIVEKSWKNCWDNLPGKVVYCGYLKLKNSKEDWFYKLQVGYEAEVNPKKLDSWRVNVIKEEREKISYWSKESQNWQGISNVKSEEFTTFQDEKYNGWQKIEELSINKEAGRRVNGIVEA